jgi:hypothetical protein
MKRTLLEHAILILALAGTCRAASPGELAAIWDDPVFQKQFIAGYGINADIEPRVTPEEIALLEKVRPLMADNLP